MTNLRILVALLCLSSALPAQQLSLFTQYRENATLINPAAMESDFLAFGQNLTFGASYRSQWSGISGNPRTQTVRASYLNKDWSGVTLVAGGHLINDQTGPTGLTGFYGRIGGVIGPDPEYSGLAIALSGGIVQYRVDADKVVLREQGDVIGSMDQTQLFPDVGLGLYFYNYTGEDVMLYMGASVPQIIGLDLTFTDDNGDFLVKRTQHFYGMLGLYKFFRNDAFLEPSVWVKYTAGAPVNLDFNLRYQLPNALWIGTGVSSAGNFHMETGLAIGEAAGLDNTIKIGYGFDSSFSTFGPTVGGTHEINLSVSFDR